MSKQAIHSDDAPAAIGTYSQAIRVGDLVFLSGQIPLDAATMEVVDGDFEARARQVFENLKAVAAAAGGNPNQIVKLTVFLTDLSNFAMVNSVMEDYFDKPFPARAAVGVASLPKGVDVEADAKKLERLGLYRVEDLLFLLPLRYEDRTQLVKIGALQAGKRCLITGEVLLAEVAFRGRRNLLVRIDDGSGQITLRFFHFSRQQQAQFQPGVHVTCFGEARKGSAGLEMIHPEYRILGKNQDAAINESLTAIYPATEGVQQGRLRSLTDQALRIMRDSPPSELLPKSVREKLNLPVLVDAIVYLHRPPPDADVERMVEGTHPCQKRLAFEELLAHYLSLRNLRALAQTERARPLEKGGPKVARFIADLPFTLTTAQERVVDEILNDLAQPHPMMRLIQGDVGSGKTVVAAIACLKAISCGVQAAIMAPTELLAEQHWRSFSDWFEPLGIEPAWLSGSQRAVARREALASIADGSAGLVVGTHALFQEGVEFKNLALVIIDEQHRFGVHQVRLPPPARYDGNTYSAHASHGRLR